jgi:hypothetical protein
MQKPVLGVPGTGGAAEELRSDRRWLEAGERRGGEPAEPLVHKGPLKSHREARPVIRNIMDFVWTALRERRLDQSM